MTTYNIYCDESGHLPNDQQPTMVLGAITVSEDHARQLSDELRQLKRLHGLAPGFEMKWTKISGPHGLPVGDGRGGESMMPPQQRKIIAMRA